MEHQPYWPDAGAQAVMQQRFKAYPRIAYGDVFSPGGLYADGHAPGEGGSLCRAQQGHH